MPIINALKLVYLFICLSFYWVRDSETGSDDSGWNPWKYKLISILIAYLLSL